MFRRHLQLTTDVVLYKLSKELSAFILQQEVKANAGADKDLLDSRDGPQLSKKLKVIGVICI